MLVAISGFLLARDVSTVRSSLVAAESELTSFQRALGEADLSAAADHLDEADRELAEARTRSSAALWNIAGSIPGISGPIETVRNVVDVASATTQLGDVALRDGADLVEAGLDITVTDGSVDLEPILDAGQIVSSLPTAQLETAVQRLADNPPGWAPAEVSDARLRTLQMADDVLATVDNADALLSVLPSYLGHDEPRSYFLGMQTSSELRGTGGLIAYYSVLTVDQGSFELDTVDVYEGLDDDLLEDDEPAITERIGALAGDTDAGVDADPAFEGRYAHTAATALFSNINVDPDLPTTARVALDLYADRIGEPLDGVILLDAIGLQAILEATDATLTLPDEVIAGTDLPSSLPADQFAQFVTTDVYDTFGADFALERRDLLTAIGTEAFGEVFDGGWDGARVGQALARSSNGRHLQVYSEDEDEQAAFEQVNAAGRFLTEGRGDRLAITINNAVGGKQDVHLGHHTEVHMQLRGPHRGEADDEAVVWRSSRIRSELHNPLSETDYDPYIVGNCLVSEFENQCFEGPAAYNRSWYSVWTPGSDRLYAASEAGASIGMTAGGMHDHRVFDHYLTTPPSSERMFELELDGPVTMTLDGTELVYEFTWWRQAKGVPDIVDLQIDAPGGWEVVDSELTGGNSGLPLLGPDAEVDPIEMETDPSGLRLRGAVSSDVTVQMRLARS